MVPEQLLTLLKICLLILLYLFFLRVLRVVWVEVARVDTAGAAPATVGSAEPKVSRRDRKQRRREPRGDPSALVIVQPATEPLTAYALADGLTLGRGTQCSIVLNDSFLSGTHARIVHLDGQWTLEDLGSTNGTFVNGAAIGGSVLLGIGDQIQLGGIVIEVR